MLSGCLFRSSERRRLGILELLSEGTESSVNSAAGGGFRAIQCGSHVVVSDTFEHLEARGGPLVRRVDRRPCDHPPRAVKILSRPTTSHKTGCWLLPNHRLSGEPGCQDENLCPICRVGADSQPGPAHLNQMAATPHHDNNTEANHPNVPGIESHHRGGPLRHQAE